MVLSDSIEAQEEKQYMSERDLVRQEYNIAIEDMRRGGLIDEFEEEVVVVVNNQVTQEATTDIVDHGLQVKEHAPGPPIEEAKDVKTMSITMRQLFGVYFKKGSGRYFKSYHIQFKRALEKYEDKGVTVALEELRQLHNFRTWDAVKISTLTKDQRRKIIVSSSFFKE